jgi:regulator of protease activity HflC (stomatin/prohibitin superfamily)
MGVTQSGTQDFPLVKLIAGGVVALFLLIAVFSSWVNITQGQVGVVFDKTRGGVLPQTLGQGWHFKTPFTQWIQEYPVSLRTFNKLGIGEGTDKSSNALDLPTLEGQHIQQDISIVYNVDAAKAAFVFDKFQGAEIEAIESTFIRRLVTSVANNVTGKYSIMDIYGPKKTDVQAEITAQLAPEMERWGFHLDRVNLGAAKFPETIEASLQAKIAAQQTAETAKFKLQQANIDKDSAVAEAEGEAKSALIKARANAEGNRLLQESLTPKLISLKAIEKWDGHYPQTMLGGNSVPMIQLQAKEVKE